MMMMMIMMIHSLRSLPYDTAKAVLIYRYREEFSISRGVSHYITFRTLGSLNRLAY